MTETGVESEAGTLSGGRRPPEPQRPPPHDQPTVPVDLGPGWRKIEILGRPVAGIMTAVVVATVGFCGQGFLSEREVQITERTAMEQNARLYTQIMSSREQAESGLRKDMFEAILGEFLKAGASDGTSTNGARLDADTLETRLLKLELLALNFGESLSLSPLFLRLNREIDQLPDSPPSALAAKDGIRARLQGLARRVSRKQLAALSSAGVMFDFEVPVERVKKGEYTWPDDRAEANRELLEESGAWKKDAQVVMQTHELRGVERAYQFTFRHADTEGDSVLVSLQIGPGKHEAVASGSVEMSFELNYFNFPMIDNTRLSKDQRFALVMDDFDDNVIKVVGICFPGMYASLQDRPFMNDIITSLQETGRAASSPPERKTGVLGELASGFRGLWSQ